MEMLQNGTNFERLDFGEKLKIKLLEYTQTTISNAWIWKCYKMPKKIERLDFGEKLKINLYGVFYYVQSYYWSPIFVIGAFPIVIASPMQKGG